MHPAIQHPHEPGWCRLWIHASSRKRYPDSGMVDPSQLLVASVVLLQSSQVCILLDSSLPSFRMPCAIFIESICLVVLTDSMNRSHCNSGMVFAVNPPTTGNTFAAYVAKAATATHPDPALHQTAPFTPTTSNSTTTATNPSAAPSLTSGSSATTSGATTSTTHTSGAVKIEGRVGVFVGLVGMAMGTLVL
jgi:hypothetical protein